jgi:cysteinyl-tRNA synthetase
MQELVKMGISPLVYRYMFLNSHYRNGMEFSIDGLKNSMKSFEKLQNSVSSLPDGGVVNEKYGQEFVNFISDDLAIPQVMALVWGILKDSSVSDADKKVTILDFDKILGLNLSAKQTEENVPEEVLDLARQRMEAKNAKDWARADELREKIKSLGYLVEDFKNDCKIRKLVLS